MAMPSSLWILKNQESNPSPLWLLHWRQILYGLSHWECPHNSFAVVLVQLLSYVQVFATPWTAASQASLSLIISRNFPKYMPIESVMLSNHLIFCCLLLLLPSIFPSLRVFSDELAER